MWQVMNFDQQRVVTLIGSGGKTTLMYYLAAQAVKNGMKVLLTTTTKIFFLQKDAARFVAARDFASWLIKLRARVVSKDYLITGREIEEGKILGLEAAWIDRLAEKNIFDLILVEGDGSRQKPLKAPKESEPVIPRSTTLLLPIIGLSGIDQPLTTDFVQRVEQFSLLTGLSSGERIDATDVFRVYQHPDGYDLLNQSTQYPIIPILHQADDLHQEESGAKLAKLFLSSGIKQVLMTTIEKSGTLNWRAYS